LIFSDRSRKKEGDSPSPCLVCFYLPFFQSFKGKKRELSPSPLSPGGYSGRRMVVVLLGLPEGKEKIVDPHDFGHPPISDCLVRHSASALQAPRRNRSLSFLWGLAPIGHRAWSGLIAFPVDEIESALSLLPHCRFDHCPSSAHDRYSFEAEQRKVFETLFSPDSSPDGTGGSVDDLEISIDGTSLLYGEAGGTDKEL